MSHPRRLTALVAWAAVLPWGLAWADDEAPEEPRAEDRRSVLILEQPPEPLEPREAPTAEEADIQEARALFAVGRFHEQRGQQSEAIRYYQRALRHDPQSLDILRQIVPLAFELERMGEAIRYALKIVELDPTDPLLPRLGEYLIEQGDAQGAVELFERSLEAGHFDRESSQYVALMARMGDLYFAVENYEKAADAFAVIWDAMQNPEKYNLVPAVRRVLSNQPAPTFDRFGETFLKTKRFDEARRAFARSNDLEPNAPLLAFREAQVLLAEDQAQAALARLNAYFEDPQPLSVEGEGPVELLARLYEVLDREPELFAKLQDLHKQHPQQADLGFRLADELRQREQWDEAEALYVKLLKETPRADEFVKLAELYKARGRLDRLIATLGQLYEPPDLDSIEVNIGDLPAGRFGGVDPELVREQLRRQRRQQMLEAQRTAARGVMATMGPKGAAVDADPELAAKLLEAGAGWLNDDAASLGYGARLVLGHLAGQAESPDLADRFFAAALKLQTEDEDRLDAYQEWLSASVAQERFDKGAEILRSLIDDQITDPANQAVASQLAVMLEMSGQTDEALKVVDEALRVRPGSATLQMRKAWIYYHAMKYDEAIKAYEAVIDQHPRTEDAKQARMILSSINVIQGNIPRAVSLLEEVLDEYPDDPTALNDLGYLWADQNTNLERALEMIRQAVEARPDSQAFRDSLGWVLYRLERYEEALVEMEKAIELDPDDVDGVVLDHLGDVYFKNNRLDDAIDAWQRALKAFEDSRRSEPEKIEAVREKLRQHGGDRPEGQIDPPGDDTP